LTVQENIEFFTGLYGVPRRRRAERRDWVLEIADLAARRDALVGTLPLGWKQRLALGCAVLHEPSLLFLDEPTSGVDPLSRRRFWDLIATLAERGTTVFVSTHYMEEAESCHRLALMNRGRLIALDTPPGLRASIRTPLLELDVSDGVRAVEILREDPAALEAGLYGRAIHLMVRDEAAARAQVGPRLQAAGIELRSMRRIEPSLEDVFVALVSEAGGPPVD
jgi:drug efflux transport system ATP-binding protein